MKKKSIWAFALIAMLTCLGRSAVASDGAFDPVEFINPLRGRNRRLSYQPVTPIRL